MLTELAADLFAVPDLDALGHGVNCAGVMGAGIAVDFRERFPAMLARYRLACAAGLRPGHIVAAPETSPRWVYCLATQPRPGRCATLAAVREALDGMVAHALAHGVRRIGLPRIGCGYGGLRWSDVRPLVERAADRVDIVVAFPGAP